VGNLKHIEKVGRCDPLLI